MNANEFFQDKVKANLEHDEIQALEQQDRDGYLKFLQDPNEIATWQSLAAWPEDPEEPR